MSTRILNRYSEPTKLDTAEQYALCLVGEFYYIQISPDAENPKWHYLGEKNTSDILLKLLELFVPKSI